MTEAQDQTVGPMPAPLEDWVPFPPGSRAAEPGWGRRCSIQEIPDLMEALERDELELHYQPIIDLDSGGVVGAEALLRWMRPDGEDVPPEVIARFADRCGLGEELTLWVLRRGIRDIDRWKRSLGPGLAINVSPRVMARSTFIERMLAILGETGFDAGRLTVELTELALEGRAATVKAGMEELRRHGIGASLDDFGNGFSDLARLDQLPFSELKIDRGFITRKRDRTDGQLGADQLTGVMSEIGHSLGMTVVIEGVETVADLEVAHGMAADRVQGYYFSPPVARGALPGVSSGIERRQRELVRSHAGRRPPGTRRA